MQTESVSHILASERVSDQASMSSALTAMLREHRSDAPSFIHREATAQPERKQQQQQQ